MSDEDRVEAERLRDGILGIIEAEAQNPSAASARITRKLAELLKAGPRPAGQRTAIVFVQRDPTADGVGFTVHAEGFNRARMAVLPREEWSTAEFWGWRCFEIIIGILQQTPHAKGVRY